jgi:hypothetical protein
VLIGRNTVTSIEEKIDTVFLRAFSELSNGKGGKFTRLWRDIALPSDRNVSVGLSENLEYQRRQLPLNFFWYLIPV